MASLKEIKTRIASVKNTLKITSSMKLVASAKLHKAQMAIETMMPYNQHLTGIMNHLLNSESAQSFTSPLTTPREVNRVAIVTISSNASLCGAFNNNIIRFTQGIINEYEEKLGQGSILLIPIGRKVAQAMATTSEQRTQSSKEKVQGSKEEDSSLFTLHSSLSSDSSLFTLHSSLSSDSSLFTLHSSLIPDFIDLAEHPTYAQASALSSYLTDLYLRGEIDRVEILYTHYKNMAVQELRREQYLPIDKSLRSTAVLECRSADNSSGYDASMQAGQSTPSHTEECKGWGPILEPSLPKLLANLLPQALASRMYALLLDSQAAEHAARTFAMQTATDNGDALLQELNLQFNKVRQQSITNELLDIVGGQMR